ncbi:hypothetical protein GOV09_01705 [Candidatus Woesearchaeota archaeon]|nr:hypothetical protein [Candidatus Woesearchaeota archaeon]
MVYVFGGFDIPVFEIIFIVSVLLIIGLTIIILGVYYILKEVQALRGLIRREGVDIKEFDADIAKLEKGAVKKKDNELTGYVKACRSRGYSSAQIRKTLLGAGWDEKAISQALGGRK